MAILVQFLGVFAASSGAPYGTEAIPLPALDVFAVLALMAAGFYQATRMRLFSGAEMLCILYVLLIAAPLINTGFWRMILASTSTVTRNVNWEEYDIFSSRLWPHGNDLVGEMIKDLHAAALSTTGTVSWQNLEVAPDNRHDMPVLENVSEGETSSVRVRLPVMDKDRVALPLNEPYMLTMRARAQNLQPQSRYFARIYYDDRPDYALEAFSSFDQKKSPFFNRKDLSGPGLTDSFFPAPFRTTSSSKSD